MRMVLGRGLLPALAGRSTRVLARVRSAIRRVTRFSHMANREHDNQVAVEPVPRYVPRCPKCDEQLAEAGMLGVEPAQLRKPGKEFCPVADRPYGAPGCILILLAQKLVKTLEVSDRIRRVDYLCHLGARLGRRVPSESTQLSTSA